MKATVDELVDATFEFSKSVMDPQFDLLPDLINISIAGFFWNVQIQDQLMTRQMIKIEKRKDTRSYTFFNRNGSWFLTKYDVIPCLAK